MAPYTCNSGVLHPLHFSHSFRFCPAPQRAVCIKRQFPENSRQQHTCNSKYNVCNQPQKSKAQRNAIAKMKLKIVFARPTEMSAHRNDVQEDHEDAEHHHQIWCGRVNGNLHEIRAPTLTTMHAHHTELQKIANQRHRRHTHRHNRMPAKRAPMSVRKCRVDEQGCQRQSKVCRGSK